MNKPRVKEEKLRTHIVLRKDQRESIDAICASHDRGASAVIRDLIDCSLPQMMKNSKEFLHQRFAQDQLAIELRQARQAGDTQRVERLLEQV